MIKGFDEAVSRVKYLIEYGFHCNDLSHNDFEDDLTFVFDKLAKENGHPEIDWEYHGET
jgi:hypothetical protein